MKRLNLLSLTVVIAVLPACTDAPILVDEAGHRHQAIVNGSLDTGHPAVGALHSGNQAACTATLVGQRTVLTAAHCVLDPDTGNTLQPVNFYVNGFPGGTKYTATAVVTHPNYSGGNQSDIAVVRLTQDVAGVQPMQVTNTAPTMGESVLLVGYGLPAEETGEFGTKRQAASVIGKVTSTVISFYGASATKGNTCNGDSGGPTFANRGGVEMQIGVHSTKGGVCGQEGHDMRVDAFYQWIAAQAQGDLYVGGPVDQAPPQVQILNPLVGAVLGPAFNVDVKANDDVGVTHVVLFLNGSKISERGTAPFQFPMKNLTNGNHTIEAVAFDEAGHTASAVISITVKLGGTQPPTTPPDDPPSNPTTPTPPDPGAYGATCSKHAQCQSGLCALDTVTGQRFCTSLCDVTVTDSCPQGNICQPSGDKAVCGPLHNELSGDDQVLNGGCSVGGLSAPPTRPTGLLLLLGLGLLVVLSRRR